MRLLKHLLVLLLGLISIFMLFQMADKVNPTLVHLNSNLSWTSLLSWTLLIGLFYHDKPKVDA